MAIISNVEIIKLKFVYYYDKVDENQFRNNNLLVH